MRSPCASHACSACCHDTEMPLTTEDVQRLERLGHRREDFLVYGEDGVATLKTVDPMEGATQPGRPCFFLREGQCSVYGDRPAGCRIYPLVMNERGRVVRDEDCPHRAEFPVDPSAGRRIHRVLSNLQRHA